MPTIITGPLESSSVLSANQMPDNDRMLYLLKPYQSQFFQKLYFSDRRSKAVTDSTGKFSYFEDELYPHQDILSGSGISGGAASEDNIGLTNPTYFQEDDMLMIEETEEMVYVDSTASSQVDITSMSGSNITAVAAGSYVKKVGSYNMEINVARTATATQEVQVSNYLTIFNESVEMSSREQGAKHFTNGRSFDEQLEKRTIEMKQMFERNFMFSTESGRDTSGTYPKTFGKGFLGIVTTNRISYTNVTEPSFDAFLQAVYDTGGSNERDLYLGSSLSIKINQLIKDRYQVTGIPAKEYGVSLMRYLLPFGMTNIYWNPRMDGGFKTKGFAVDWENITLRYMAPDKKGSQKFRVEEDVEVDGTSSSKAKLYADLGIEIPNEIRHGIFEEA